MEPSMLNSILGKALSAQRAAEAAKKARELVRRKSVLTKSTLPGKLADCQSSDKSESEIFLVEGDSAGMSANQKRSYVHDALWASCSKACIRACVASTPLLFCALLAYYACHWQLNVSLMFSTCNVFRWKCKASQGSTLSSHSSSSWQNPECRKEGRCQLVQEQ